MCDEKSVSTMINVFTGWIMGIVGVVVNTVLLPINLVLGLITGDVITLFGSYNLDDLTGG